MDSSEIESCAAVDRGGICCVVRDRSAALLHGAQREHLFVQRNGVAVEAAPLVPEGFSVFKC